MMSDDEVRGSRGAASGPTPRASAEALDLGEVLRALSFAARKHRHQRRKDREASPYINHPIDVADILVNEAAVRDVITVVAAVLHDTVEDTDTRPEELAEAFGAEVAAVVAEVTDDKSLPKAERKRLQEEHAPHASPRAQQVKLADKIANLRDIARSPPHNWDLERRRAYFDWAKRVVDGVRDRHEKLAAIFDEAYEARP
jgi:guanosine-3',5'-bis(diphosphate) 3'-pyrophosphohydrolase